MTKWAVAAVFATCTSAHAEPVRVLDNFNDASAWTAVSSDQVEAKLRSADGALCLDFDFHGVSGYAAVRRTLAIDYPENYEFDFRLRGDAPANALQFKVADASGDNVWWVNRPDFAFPKTWTAQRYKKRQVDFAWGPIKDRTLRHSDHLEFTLYAGNGGRGSVCFDDLALRELPPTPASWPVPVARASSALKAAPAANAVDGRADTVWRSDPKRGAEQTLTLDLGAEREFGGLVLRWDDEAFASDYEVALSDDGTRWRDVRHVAGGNGGLDPLDLPESEARYVRLALHGGPHNAYALREIDVRDLAFGASANAFFSELAKQSPRGWYPRGFYNEQTYWTVVGTDGGHETGLFSEDGALEVARGGFSIEPFLIENRTLTTWADVKIDHALRDGYLPIPSATWTRGDIRLTTTVFAHAHAHAKDSHLVAGYELENRSDQPRSITLALALRPFQVNPSVQFLNTPGGVSPIHKLAWDGTAVAVDGKARVFPLEAPNSFGATTFDAGMIVAKLGTSFTPAIFRDARGVYPNARKSPKNVPDSIDDPTGLASGALIYTFNLAAHERRTLTLAIPLDGDGANPLPEPAERDGWFARERDAVAADWHRRLDAVGLRLPASAPPLANTLRTALAHILISRDGPALRPGTRAYARSWIRDGAMMAEALLRLGRDDVPRDYFDWYAPYQFKNGKVPCCVDARGSDPVPENDSHGELIHLASEIYRYTGDRSVLERAWPHVDAAVRYMDGLRASEREPNRNDERKAFYGLMPASISHEGYSAKPMHSYWDDFWALLGYKDAVAIAETLGRRDDVARLTASRDEFRTDLYASLRTAIAAHSIDYLPGSAELGDFDATSTTIALSPAGEQAALPQDALRGTFERYWKLFAERRDSSTWKDYTPYEWRTVGTFVRLGWRERAQAAIDFFMHDRRPPAWNQWAEVVGRDPRESRFIGDMPHGWVASDFIRSALDLFAYERDADHAIVLAGGVPANWLDGDGIAIDHLRTRYGTLSYSLRREGDALHLRVDSDAKTPPPGGYVLPWPLADAPAALRTHDRNVKLIDGAIHIARAPADVVATTRAMR